MNRRIILASLTSLTGLIFNATAGTTMVNTSKPTSGESCPVSSNSTSDGRALRPCLCQSAFTGSEAPFAVNVTAGYDSSYLCRGMDMGEDMFSATLTADAKLGGGWTWTGSFRYMDLQSTDFSELNAYTGLFYTAGDLTFGPSFRWYQFQPNGGEMNAYDLGLQALYKAGPLDLTAGYYYETESEGSYAEIGVSTRIAVAENIALVPSAQISYTDGWVNPALSGLNEANVRLAAHVKASENVTVIPYVAVQFPLEALEEAQDTQFSGGLSVSVTF